MKADLAARALAEPTCIRAWSPAAWDRCVLQARRSGLLGRLAACIDRLDLWSAVPAAPTRHLQAALTLADAQRRDVLHEVRRIGEALAAVGVQTVLLKGAAYVVAGLPAAQGRLFTDVDIIVPKPALPAVEASLMQHGWATTHHTAYDQRYYREWMHELPPMRHVRRGTVLDVHHAILPETARLHPDSRLLLDAAHAIAGEPGIAVLAPPDMVLHSMTHLFHNEEMSHGLRDLTDIDLLLRDFGVAPAFWDRLVRRAADLGLSRPLYYGLRFSHRLLGTPVPAEVLRAVEPAAPRAAWLQDWLWRHALQSWHPSVGGPGATVALAGLYMRAHWLRMPPGLLLRHLATKAVLRPRDDTAQAR
jgi:hypothetical protein